MLLPVGLINGNQDRTTLAALSEDRRLARAVRSCSPALPGRVFLEDELETSAGSSTWSGGPCCGARCACRGTASRPYRNSSRRRCRPVPCSWRRRSTCSPTTGGAAGRQRPGPAVIVADRGGGGRRLLAGHRRPGHPHRHDLLPRRAVVAAGRADPAGGHRAEDPQHRGLVRGGPDLRPRRPGAGVQLGAGRRQRLRAQRAGPAGRAVRHGHRGLGALASYPVYGALPAMPAPHQPRPAGSARPASTPPAPPGRPRRYVCGDHRTTARSRARWRPGPAPPASSWPT